MIKELIQEEDIMLINKCTPNTGSPKHIKQIWIGIKGEIENNTITVGNFNTTLIAMDMVSREKINTATVVLNNTIDKLHLIDSYKTLLSKTAEYIFFWRAHVTFSRIDHMLGYKQASTTKRRIEIISIISFWPQGWKTRITYSKKKKKKNLGKA